MAVTYRFTKAAGKKPKKPKKSKKKALTKLNDFLKQAEPEAVKFLIRDLKAMGNSITYKELREAYLGGGMTQKQFEKWQHKYSALVTGTLKPKWEQAAAQAAQEIKNKYPYFHYEPGIGAAADWIKQHGAELVTNLAQDQKDALNAMAGYFSGYTGITPDEAAQMMRPCIGLTKPQAVANLRYQDAVKAAYQKLHPNAAQATLDKKAKEAGARYSARQHRYRAHCIARTELAFGYNAGAYGATKDAQAQGYIGECKKKWLTAYDERVCPICSAIDGETADMDAPFSIGKLLPPAHPLCRCTVAYEEVVNAIPHPQPQVQAPPPPQPQPQQPPQMQTPTVPPAVPASQTPSSTPAPTAAASASLIPPDIGIPPGMTDLGTINLGGTGVMHLYEDASGKQWLFKPAEDKYSGNLAEFRAYVQQCGYKVQAIVDPDTAVKVGIGTLNGRFGAFQERLDTMSGGFALKDWQHNIGWNDNDLQISGTIPQIQREHITDWLLGNFDSHGGNFVTRADFKLIGIDKEQSFKYMKDQQSHKMSFGYHPNAKYGETEPVYNTLFRKYAQGNINLDLNQALQYIKRVEQIPDDEYREIFRKYAESLTGPGQTAENLLDAIVERKKNLRETCRDFFSDLETQRTGTKTVFLFSDELSGAAKPKAPKKPKKPKAPAAPKKPVKTESGYMISDALTDPAILPDTMNGVAIRADKEMLEQLNLRGRKVIIDGKEKYEITGKLTEEAWINAADNAKKRGYKHDFQTYLQQPNGTYLSSNVNFSTPDGARITDANGSIFDVYGDTVDKKLYAMDGFFRVRIDATGDPAKDSKALEQILDKAGLRNLTADPTAAEELLLRKTRIAWQRDPQAFELNCRYETGAAREQAIDNILKNAQISDSRVKKMKLKEVYPGYSTHVDDKAAAEYRKAGATHIWHGVESKDAVVAICQSDGLTASLHRTTAGMKSCGASPDWDMKSGGADSVFVRLGTRNNRVEYTDCPLCGRYRIIIDRKELNRTDWYAHESDSYGRARLESYDWKHRPSSLQFVEDMAHSYLYGNEIMLRHGIRKESFVGISCAYATDRADLIQAFKKAGITEVNGIKVEDFVQVHKTLAEDSDRGLKGLKYYNQP